jgi:glycosyl transferase family 25
MKIHLINLESSIDRLQFMDRQLKKINRSYELFAAVDGRRVSQNILDSYVDLVEIRKYPNWMTPGAIGCALSHYFLYQKIATLYKGWNLILEDDILLNSNINELIDKIDSLDVSYSNTVILLYSQSNFGEIQLRKKININSKNYSIHSFADIKTAIGTGAYFIHSDVALEFTNRIRKIFVASDSWDVFFNEKIFTDLCCTFPFAAKPAMFKSTIGYGRDSNSSSSYTFKLLVMVSNKLRNLSFSRRVISLINGRYNVTFK